MHQVTMVPEHTGEKLLHSMAQLDSLSVVSISNEKETLRYFLKSFSHLENIENIKQ